jgi:hypothetical protein
MLLKADDIEREIKEISHTRKKIKMTQPEKQHSFYVILSL